MSRTYRNRNTIPKGWTVRDDGVPYFNGDDKFGNDHLETSTPHRWARGCFMNRPMPRYRRSLYQTERKKYRKAHYQEYRAKVKNLMKHGRFDDILSYRKTGGWESW